MTTATAVQRGRARNVVKWRQRAIDYNAWILLVLLMVVGTVITRLFLTPSNLADVLEQSAIIGVLAIGQFLVVLTGGIDLSVGSLVALVAMTSALAMPGTTAASVLVGLATGAAAGLISGMVIVFGKLPPFIVTFGMLAIGRGLALAITGGKQVNIPREGTLAAVGSGLWPVLVWAIVIAIVWFFLARTRTGTYVYAVGGNSEAARVSGVRTGWVTVIVYGASGLCAAIAGLLFLARSGVALPTYGDGYELQTIAAVVVGGVSLFGGQGRLSGAVIGVIFMTMLSNILDLVGANPFWSFCVIGAVLWLAVMLRGLLERIK